LCVEGGSSEAVCRCIALPEGKQRWKQIRIELVVRPAIQSEG
jgi:hypothetical protein